MTMNKTWFSTIRMALGATALTLVGGVAHAQTFTSNVIIQGSLCVGQDCVTGESFGFDTLRLKENNLRINFADTSTSASFPTNDWRIVINDTSNGGASYFAVEDSTAARQPFRVTAGAPSNSLFVSSAGRLGLGTSTPVVNLHVVSGNTPTLRLEQNGSSGFTAQTWDVAGNEANFFVRDVTNGSTLPLRIEPGTASNTLYLDSTENIGMGTTSPSANLHVLGGGSAFSADANTLAMFQNNAAANSVARVSILSGNTGVGQLAFGDAQNEFAGRIRYFHSDDHMDFLVGGNVEALRVFGTGPNTLSTATSTAVLTSAGVWQNASSRALKQNIHSLSADAAMDTLAGLKPVTFNYIKEPDETTVGFIAEDVPELVATASRTTLSSLDIVAVLTRVVQEQQQANLQQQQAIDALTQRLNTLTD